MRFGNPTGNRQLILRLSVVISSLLLIALLAACGSGGFVDPAASNGVILDYEAEDATVVKYFGIGSDEYASGEQYLVQQPGTGNGTGDSEEAWIEITVPASGNYTLWARLRADSKDGDAIYLGINGVTRRVFPITLGEYVWLEINSHYLMQGKHRISVGRGEPGVRLDLLVATTATNLTSYDLSNWFEKRGTGGGGGFEPDPTPDPGTPNPPTTKPPVSPPAGGDAWMSLRGDPSFNRSDLPSDARVWYDRLWRAIDNKDPVFDIEWASKSDDAYIYAREVFMHNHALLLALRATGDLKFLDEVDVMAQNMRATLYDGWCGGVSGSVTYPNYGTMYAKDGYLNFRRKEGGEPTEIWYCRDTADLEETLLHGHLAMVMYAYHMNRDLKSPAGIDYGERADFWLNYLRNHFEAKWRERSKTQFPAMDFINAKFCHTYSQFSLYYYYVGSTLADLGDSQASAYLNYARTMTNDLFETKYVPGKTAGGFMNTSTPLGPAVVYSFGAPGQPRDYDAINLEACPTTYSRYMTAANLEFYFEGFYRWDDDIMTKIANGYAHFVMDTPDLRSRSEPFAAGVTGSKTVEGIPATKYRDRISVHRYVVTTIGILGLWEGSGKIDGITEQAFSLTEANPTVPGRVQLPVTFLVRAMIDATQ